MRQNKSQGYYFGAYQIEAGKYQGADFSRSCFIFSGQGSAFPGMFKEQYLSFRMVGEKFKKADVLAKELGLSKISDYILKPAGLKEETLPIVRNLALFTLEVALHEVLISQKIIPQIVTGHSFGEYAALVASGIISFEEMFDVIYHRDLFCPKANEAGFMVAVNADEQSTKKILGKTEFYISNLNSPQQTVISVSPGALDEVKRLLEKSKKRHKILSNVPQPYHSPYLSGAKDKIKQYLKTRQVGFKKPQIPLFSSVAQKLIDERSFKEEDLIYILTNQIIVPVNFIRQISTIHNLRCFNFIELGAGNVLTGFVKDILAGKPIKTDSALNLLKAQKKNAPEIISFQNNRLFSLISRTIGKITGYEIEKISWEDRYQEDLGIDSIKKAEILLTVLKESNIDPGDDFNTSGFGSIKDTVAYLENASQAGGHEKKAVVKKETHFERYVSVWAPRPFKNYIFESERKTASLLVNLQDILGQPAGSAEKIETFLRENKENDRPNIIIFSDSPKFNFNNISADEFRQGVILKIIPFFKFFRQLLKTIKQGSFNLALVSVGRSSFYVGGYASFLKSIKKELPGIFFKHIHFSQSDDPKILVNLVEKEMRDTGGVDVLYEGGQRLVADLRRAEDKGDVDLNEESAVLALGGAKGITFSLVKNISRKYRPTIYLAGKSPSENKTARVNIAELKKDNPKIYYKSLDAGDIKSLEELFEKIKNKHGKIDLIINGVGAVKIGFLKDKTDEDINYEFNNKVLPAFNILNLSLKYKPKRIINFSSIISKYGSAGQTIYTSANELVSGLTEEYNTILKSFGSSAIAVHFPPWDGVGMTQDKGILQKLREYNVSLLDAKKANELFSFDLSSSGGEPVFYLDDSDDLFYGFPLNNLESYRPLIGTLSDAFGISMSKPVFEKVFNLSDDAYLKDHAIKGTSYVPAAVGISMFLCAGSMYFKKFPILKNIEINNPIVVKNDPVRCLLEVEGDRNIKSFSIKSNVLHFHCEAESAEAKKIPARDLIIAKKEISVSSIYSDFYFKDSLYLGPTFQSMDRALIDKNSDPFLLIDNSKLLPVLGLGYYDKLIQWIDASFQALGAVALKNNLKMIPTKVSKLSVFPGVEITKYVYAIPSKTKFINGGLEGDVILINEKGEAILELVGGFIKKIGEYKESRLKIKNYKNG
ncbi:MAG: SDR family NAD(P)-dependent oxidoreductase [Patescibacteria group bacterium]